MKEVEELEIRVRELSQEDFSRFRDFFYQLEDERWDRQIEVDLKAGKFDKLIQKAQKEFSEGEAREL